jgi:hypothetical protein
MGHAILLAVIFISSVCHASPHRTPASDLDVRLVGAASPHLLLRLNIQGHNRLSSSK